MDAIIVADGSSIASPLSVVFLTIVSGVVVFVCGQIIQRLFIEPIQEQRRITGRIAQAVAYDRTLQRSDAKWGQPESDSESACRSKEREELADRAKAGRESVRILASELRATMTVIPCYKALETCRFVLKAKDVLEISFLLMKFQGERDWMEAQGAYDNVKRLLKMKTKDPEVTMNFHDEMSPNSEPLVITLPGDGSSGVWLTSPNQGPWIDATPDEKAKALGNLPNAHLPELVASRSSTK